MADSSGPRIYTKTGDAGDTGLFDGTRVPKSDSRVEAYGEVDELAACLGIARCHLAGEADLARLLEQIQIELFAVGARLADPRHHISERVGKAKLGGLHVQRLEEAIDQLESELTPLRRFILAGGSAGGAALHLARAVCRRAERRAVGLADEVDPTVVIYLNRLSDLLFVMARVANARAGVPEIEW